MNISELGPTGFFRHWMSKGQRSALIYAMKGEEKDFFSTMLDELKATIESMPSTGETDGQGESAIVYLHYFRGGVDAWITEKDVGDSDDPFVQHQAFGKVDLGYGAELGYISLQELIENEVEMDLYWGHKPLSELK